MSAPNPQRIVCHCFGLSEHEIRQVIALHDLRTVRQITQTCQAGGGCTACHRHLKRFLTEAHQFQCLTESSACSPPSTSHDVPTWSLSSAAH